ncbi:methionyl-tRNA formyltransferase [Ulvibacterium sp.]|uniref:methionyl-tRNA formyltransferase n=1 Tax=Ulvibacterium sp. TaxID=2665914 RepID=UPI003CC5AE3D
MSNKRVTLFLITKKGFRVLEALIEAGFQKNIGQIIIGRDKNQQDFSNEIERLCRDSALPYFFKGDFEAIEKSYYALAIGWRWMMKEAKNLIVLHDSLLPRYRGFAPLVNALLNRERTIGATAIWATEQYDTGDILVQKSFDVSYPIKIKAAIDLMATCYSEIALELFQMIVSEEEIPNTPQNNELATYSLWRDEEDYQIDWTRSAEAIQLFINCLGEPYKGAYSIINGRKVRIFDVAILEGVIVEGKGEGKVLFFEEGCPCIVCGSGLVKILAAIYEDSGESIFPLKSIKTRFT